MHLRFNVYGWMQRIKQKDVFNFLFIKSFAIHFVTNKTFPCLLGFYDQITVSYTSISFFAHFIYKTTDRIKAINRKSRAPFTNIIPLVLKALKMTTCVYIGELLD